MKQILYLFVAVFLLSLVSSVSPFIVSTSEGYGIEPVLIDYIKEYSTYKFHIHIINQSNGMPITSGVSCYMHLYNSTGNHLVKLEKSTISDMFDYEFIVDGNNFTLGTYQAKFQCNSSLLGGSSEIEFKVTSTGKEEPSELLLLFFIISFILLIGLTCYLALYTLGHLLALDFDLTDLSIDWGMFFIILLVYYFELQIMSNSLIDAFAGWFLSLAGFLLFVIPIIAFIISLAMGNLSKKNWKQQAPRRFKIGGRANV